MSNSIKDWEKIVSENPSLEAKILDSQKTIAAELEKILKLAHENGVNITIVDILKPSNTLSEEELASVPGGVNGCGIAAGGLGIACGIGAIFSLGVTAGVSGASIAGSGGVSAAVNG